MSPLDPTHDAFGNQLLDHHRGLPAQPARLERDDGWSGPAADVDEYFTDPAQWPELEHALLAHAHGRVLDLGAGAGRHALHLQAAGHDVLAVDLSPGAVTVCRERGVRRAQLGGLRNLPTGPFDTVLLLCQNLGLAGTLTGTRQLLVDLHERTAPNAVILADTVDPLHVEPLPPHREYHLDAGRHGRDVGQIRVRWRHRGTSTPWMDLLLVRRVDLAPLIEGTGWRLDHTHDDGSRYGVVLRRV